VGPVTFAPRPVDAGWWGTIYISRVFAAARIAVGLKHIHTRLYTPKTNGKAEGFIQTLLREWAYAWPYRSSNNRAERLPRWLVHYNHKRPHGSLDHLPPFSRIQSLVNNPRRIHS